MRYISIILVYWCQSPKHQSRNRSKRCFIYFESAGSFSIFANIISIKLAIAHKGWLLRYRCVCVSDGDEYSLCRREVFCQDREWGAMTRWKLDVTWRCHRSVFPASGYGYAMRTRQISQKQMRMSDVRCLTIISYHTGAETKMLMRNNIRYTRSSLSHYYLVHQPYCFFQQTFMMLLEINVHLNIRFRWVGFDLFVR